MSRYAHVGSAAETGGTEFDVQVDEGVRFEAPFRALVWDESEPLHDSPQNWAEIDVLEIEDDTLRYLEEAAVPVTSGMRVAELFTIDTYDLGDEVTLTLSPWTFVNGEDPGGSGFAGSTPFTFTPDQSGVYAYRFEDGADAGIDRAFFVRYTTAE